jgi:S1-C subfamily serine protease
VPSAARPAAEAAGRGVVFLRVIGDVEVVSGADLPEAVQVRTQRTGVEIATGSGFVFSPVGQVLTCSHVVSNSERTATIEGRKVELRLTVRRIEAQFPGGADAIPSPASRYDATVIAENPDLDLAVLSIAASDVPSLDLGDSDALEPGDALDAIGFPFGEDVEIGRVAGSADLPPDPSVSRGNFSAFRTDADGLRRFVQSTAPVNPGNSGGPVLDGDGYVVGVVARRLTGAGAPALGIGFAVPINLVKQFLESRGLDGALPRRMTLGPLQGLEAKGVRLRLPVGMADTSPLRARVEAEAGAALAFRLDRIVSPWDAAEAADTFVKGQAFEPFAPSEPAVERAQLVGGHRALVGRVAGTLPDGTAARMEYTVIEAGGERLLARYVGPAAQVAYNASVFRTSLASIEADVLRREPLGTQPPDGWEPSPAARPGSPLSGLVVPSGWIYEPVGAAACAGLPVPADGVSAAPKADFARVLRASVLAAADLPPSAAAAACGTPVADLPGRYRRQVEWFGTRYQVEGQFVRVDGQRLIQLEAVAPFDGSTSLQDLFAVWMDHVARPPDRRAAR